MRTLIGTLLLTMFMVSCDDFGDLNQDPNNPAEARTDLLLADAERYVGSDITNVTGTLYSQYFSEVYYTDASIYTQSQFDFSGWYYDPLSALQTIIDLNSSEETRNASNVLAGGGTENQLAVARILRAYFYHALTDRWGMIPYSEALQGEENQTPAYDSQEDIYADLLNELDEAVDQMNGDTGPTGDFIFGGDMDRWAQFANSLRMRIALRMANVDDESDINAASHFTDAYNAGPIEEDVLYPFYASEESDNPWYDRFETRIDYAISETMADTMKSMEDLRLTTYAADSANTGPLQGDGEHGLDDIEGFPYGLSQSAAGGIDNTDRSLPGNEILQQDAELPIFTMAELNLALAEAVERAWISGDAEQFYEAAIEASWQQWGVYDQATVDAYLAQPSVAYSSADWPQLIGLQKWYALFPQGNEAWAEWRRLGYPELEPAPDAQNTSGEIPVRVGYPSSETELNEENYNQAVEQQGADVLDTNLWWDVPLDQ